METKNELMLDFSRAVVMEAVSFTRDHGFRPVTERKEDKTIVTVVDRAIEAKILDGIAATFPGHAVIAEESHSVPGAIVQARDSRYCWVLDPLDGTRNFVTGFPCFATSIAVLDRGVPVVGVIVEHNLGHTYWAVRGGGAFVNEQRIRAEDPGPGQDWLVGVGSNKDALTMQVVRNWVGAQGLILRNTGSTAFHLALVARGSLAGAFCKQCKIWDIAAGALLVREAGAVFTDPRGKDLLPFDLTRDPAENIPFLAGAKGCHETLLRGIDDDGFSDIPY